MTVSILRKDAAVVPPWFLPQGGSDEEIKKGYAIFWAINTYALSNIITEYAWSVQIHH